jgi:spore maturation protein CgeB
VYHSEDDLFEKIEKFLNDWATADAISQKAYKKVLEKHTFTRRIKEVLEIITA